MKRLLLLSLTLLLSTGPASGDEAGASQALYPLTPTDWLVIGPVDQRARRPFNPDAIFERYLLEAGSPVPQAGEVLRGERKEDVAWQAHTADAKGRVSGRLAYAYTSVEVPEARIVLARLDRGAALFVNGVGCVGDIYGYGFGGLPVRLEKGTNHVYVRGSRGGFKLTFEEPPARVFAASWSRTLPDLVCSETADTVAGIYVINADTQPLEGLRVRTPGTQWLAPTVSPTTYGTAPLGMLQVQIPLRTRPGRSAPSQPETVEVPVLIESPHGVLLHETTLRLEVREGSEPLLQTFVSDIDDSVQMYGLRRPDGTHQGERPMGLVLSLHGAGVGPRGQAAAYSSKPDFWHFAATNRRPFGFDWQDWGRTDAYEVLGAGLHLSGVERSRVYLTGHSMGGHGTWHLGANDADGFAALAPSAGWASFDTYPGPRPRGALHKIWHAADAFSDTLLLVDNLAQTPVFILHGTEDDNVPVGQARTMEAALKKAGAPPATHYEEGVKHWWNGKAAKGADCVDWPGIFELFRRSQIPSQPQALRFTTTDPAVDSAHHWVSVLQPLVHGKPCRVEARWHADRHLVELDTQNVGYLSVRHPAAPTAVEVDGQLLDTRNRRTIWLQRTPPGEWRMRDRGPIPEQKRPTLSGPVKRAIGRGFIFVHGTRGTPDENQASLERARYDAQQWFYRGNGQTRLITDVAYLRERERPDLRERNILLYGNETTNAALLSLDLFRPIRCARERLTLGSKRWSGSNLGAAFVSPFCFQAAADRGTEPPSTYYNLAVVFADTGVPGTRLGYTAMTWVSGVGYPDYTLFDTSVLTRGDGGVLAAGWLDARWKLQPGGFLQKASATAERSQ